MRDGNSGSLRRACGHIKVLRLPMRDGNPHKDIAYRFANRVLRLPMRDGNGLVSRAPEHEIFVLRLPMRDGNHFYGAGEGFALPFLDYL